MSQDLFYAHTDPFRHIQEWFEDVSKLGLLEPHAVALSTIHQTASGDMVPNSRIVLVKSWSEMGFEFFTNGKSPKIRDLDACSASNMLYYWDQLHRQVRITGISKPLPAEESDRYWSLRPARSQIASMLSEQSQLIESPEAFERHVDSYIEEHGESPIPRPHFWGGYCLMPNRFEFWDGGPNRIHRRKLYCRSETKWDISYLSP